MKDPILKRMREELSIRGLSDRTKSAYLDATRRFQKHYPGPLERITVEDARSYLVHLKERELSGSSINQARCALGFLFRKVLRRPADLEGLPFHKRGKKLPVVLTRHEVRDLIVEIPDLKYRTVVMTLYSSGLRIREATRLKPGDIDSSRMRILVRSGKGDKDRETILSRTLLDQLRVYWAKQRPKQWLFPGKRSGHPMDPATIQRLVRSAGQSAGIRKNVTPHVLRHTFATHLLESGTPLPYIQRFLGHSSINTTMIYLKVTSEGVDAVVSPLDQLGL